MKKTLLAACIALSAITMTSCMKEVPATVRPDIDRRLMQPYMDSMKIAFIAFLDKNTVRQPWVNPENFSWKLATVAFNDALIKFQYGGSGQGGISYDKKQEDFMFPGMMQITEDGKYYRSIYLIKGNANHVALTIKKGTETFFWELCPIEIQELVKNPDPWTGGASIKTIDITL